MEHRCSRRKPVSLDAVFSYRSLGLVHGRIRNIGMGGMLVETGRIRIPVYAELATSLFLDDNSTTPLRLDAVVVRSGEYGVGLMFDQLTSEMRDALHSFIYGNRQPAEGVEIAPSLH
jgi:hypothetical protein